MSEENATDVEREEWIKQFAYHFSGLSGWSEAESRKAAEAA